MHLYLHIGCEKTGTSAIQRFLRINRRALEAKGVLFPRTPGEEGNHVALTVAAQDDETRDELRLVCGVRTTEDVDRFRRRFVSGLQQEVGASAAGKAILSNEHCSSRLTARSEIERLDRMLRPLFAGITVVAYVRRQDEFLISQYSSELASGRTEKLTLRAEEVRRSYYDYWPMLSAWASVFGRENLIVRRYHRRWLLAGDAVDDFCAAVGIDPPADAPGIERPPRQNESLDATTCEFLRLFNAAMPRFIAGKGMNPARGDIETMLAELSRGPVQSLAPAELAAFMASFRAANARVAEEHFGGTLDDAEDPLFGGPDDGRPRTEHPDLTLESAIGIFARLWERKQGDVLRLRREVREMRQRAAAGERTPTGS